LEFITPFTDANTKAAQHITRPAAHPPATAQDAPAARLACDEARTARIGGEGQLVRTVAGSHPLMESLFKYQKHIFSR